MSKYKKFWRGLQSVIVGSALVTKASAAILPSNAIPEAVAQWNTIRKDIPNQVPNRMLPQDLLTLLGEVIAKQSNLREAIHQSYASVARQDIQHLDDFWLSQPTITKDTAAFNTFLEIRMQVTGSFGENSSNTPYLILANASGDETGSGSSAKEGDDGGSDGGNGGQNNGGGGQNNGGGGNDDDSDDDPDGDDSNDDSTANDAGSDPYDA